MLTLRPYQEAAIDRTRASLARQLADRVPPSCILQLPTGGGKTVIASFMAKTQAERPGGSVAFICHRRELIDQTAMTFESVGLDFGYIAAGHERRAAPVQICGVQTLVNRVHRIRAPKLVIWDECHHVGAATWSKVREAWGTATHIGLTATPIRLDGKGLGSWFNDLVLGPTVSELMAEGNLSTYDAYAPVLPNLAGIRKQAGDYAKGQLESALDQGEILGGIVDNWKKLAEGRKTIGFAISVKHSQHIVEAFKSAGVPAAHLDAKASKSDRRSVLRAFAKGEIEVLFNVDLFGEGFDLAANSGLDCTVEAVILARPTASLGLHLQQVGRALRPKPEPAIILDHAGNLLRHGLPDDDRTWSLADQEVKESETGPKQCPACYAVVPRHKPACDQCGFVFPKAEMRQVEEVEGELQKIVSGAETAEQLQLELRERRREVSAAKTLDDLLRIQRSRNLPDGWAQTILAARAAPPRKARRRL